MAVATNVNSRHVKRAATNNATVRRWIACLNVLFVMTEMNTQTRTAWLAERKTGIGGSDIAALLGLSPYKTPLQLWLDKTGRSEEQHDVDTIERMYWGTVLEDAVARRYSEETETRVQRINGLLRHPEVPFAIASIDRAVISGNSRARFEDGRVKGAIKVLECKTAHALARNGANWGAPGTDEVPESYWLQCQWYLGIAALPVADLAVLFGGQKFAIYTIAADADLFAGLLDETNTWWLRHIVADTPPEPTTEDDARRLWKSHVAGREKIVDVTVADAVTELAATNAGIKALEQQAQACRDRITTAFGDAESITYMGRRLATWKANRDGHKTDWKEVAASCNATPEQIAAHTTTHPGARVLRLNTKENQS
jgi:putative phage-type endonuclease